MYWWRISCVLGLAAAWGSLVHAEQGGWDLERARGRVASILKVEQRGQPWNKINWWTDAALAEAHARKTGRPIFVFLYVSEGGPAPEPC